MQPRVKKLPGELEEEILSRLPPRSFVRLRSVCKRWNALSDEKCFMSNHLSRSRPQFICFTNSKRYSINIIGLDGVNPTIELLELDSSDTFNPWLNLNYTTVTSCHEFLFYSRTSGEKGAALWNPWMKHVKWIEHEKRDFHACGLGYDNTKPEKVYKIIGYFVGDENYPPRVAIYECAFHTFKFIDTPVKDWIVRYGDRSKLPFKWKYLLHYKKTDKLPRQYQLENSRKHVI